MEPMEGSSTVADSELRRDGLSLVGLLGPAGRFGLAESLEEPSQSDELDPSSVDSSATSTSSFD